MTSIHRFTAAALTAAACATALLLAPGAQAQSHSGHAAQPAPTAGAKTAQPATEGEVRKVDKTKGELTLKHGRIENLDMPGMTMAFKVADPKLLNTVKAGDKVKFAAEDRGGVLTVTAIELAK